MFPSVCTIYLITFINQFLLGMGIYGILTILMPLLLLFIDPISLSIPYSREGSLYVFSILFADPSGLSYLV